MPNYRRAYVPGGTYFFTVITFNRAPIFADPAARFTLSNSIKNVQKILPFENLAFVLLPDHLHCIWELPDGDADYSKRWGMIKAGFTKSWLSDSAQFLAPSSSRQRHRERNVWQRRFWEHAIRDQEDMNRHIDYIHYNPVKHGLAKCAHEWSFSTFPQWLKDGYYGADWCCCCEGRMLIKPDFSTLSDQGYE